MHWLFATTLVTVIWLVSSHDHNGHYVNQFAAEIQGGTSEAKRVAAQLGFEYIEPVGLGDYHVLAHKDVPNRHKRESEHHSNLLAGHPQVKWSQQQVAKIREKRNAWSHHLSESDREIENEAYGELAASFNDPMWVKKEQDWYMLDHAKTPENDTQSVKADLGVVAAWQKGYTGKGVILSILDDGLEWNHTDIQENYSPEASFDINANDSDPFPRYDITNENNHGTRCAGVIAMVGNNKWCGVGVAPHAKVGGVRMLDGDITDVTESKSVSFNVNNIDIMSASWGPSDNGRMVDGPGKMGNEAFIKGIKEGRHGRGIIYIWASGNGGHRGDNCECDGYVSSPYTISISATTTSMRSPYYVEHCPSTMATTFSSGGYNEGQIVSADLHNKCTKYFTGTSASAPQGAGLVALALQANPYLGWRDVQHLIVWSAKPYPLYNNKGWKTNAAGFKVNHRFGFGLMSAINMVELAEKWKNVGPRLTCEIAVNTGLPKELTKEKFVTVKINVNRKDCAIRHLEHVELVMTAVYTKRGDLSVDLTSAQGTKVSLMRPRDNDFDTEGYKDWPFMSVQTWGENPRGEWLLKVWDDQSSGDSTGQVKKVTLRLFGTEEMPPIQKESPNHRREYNFQMKDVVNKKFPSGDVTGDIFGKVAGWFNLG